MEDIIGKRFGRLFVISVNRKEQKYNSKGIKDGYKYYYLCKCDCGNTVEVDRNSLRFNKTKSCGCIKSEKSRLRKTTHGLSKTKLYRTYNGMKNRCYRENLKEYCNYGGRGIKVCNEWLNDFNAFYIWAMNNGYSEGLSIDRIDVNGNYEPNNCRWITMTKQASNKRNNHLLTYQGKTKTIADWARETGIASPTIRKRINDYGWTVEKALSKVIK